MSWIVCNLKYVYLVLEFIFTECISVCVYACHGMQCFFFFEKLKIPYFLFLVTTIVTGQYTLCIEKKRKELEQIKATEMYIQWTLYCFNRQLHLLQTDSHSLNKNGSWLSCCHFSHWIWFVSIVCTCFPKGWHFPLVSLPDFGVSDGLGG